MLVGFGAVVLISFAVQLWYGRTQGFIFRVASSVTGALLLMGSSRSGSGWRRSSRPDADPARYGGSMDIMALEIFFIGLLGLASLAIVFVSAVVLRNLFRGQR